MLINFYCFTSHVYYFRLQIYDKTIIEFSLWFSPLEMYNKTIINVPLPLMPHLSRVWGGGGAGIYIDWCIITELFVEESIMILWHFTRR